MAHNSFDVDDVFFVELEVLVAGQVRKDILSFVPLVNLHNQHLLRRYLDVDLVPKISLILPPIFALRAFGAFALSSSWSHPGPERRLVNGRSRTSRCPSWFRLSLIIVEVALAPCDACICLRSVRSTELGDPPSGLGPCIRRLTERGPYRLSPVIHANSRL